MRKAIVILVVSLSLMAANHDEKLIVQYTDLEMYATSCFDDTGSYIVTYVAEAPKTYAEEVELCSIK